jgi:hypothetical protein
VSGVQAMHLLLVLLMWQSPPRTGAAPGAAAAGGEAATVGAGGSVLRRPPSEMVALAYRGILGREPDTSGHATYTSFLTQQNKDVGWLCDILCHSEEFRNYTRTRSPGEVASQLHLGIEGCADEVVVVVTQQLVSCAGRGAESCLQALAKRAARMILRASGRGAEVPVGGVWRGGGGGGLWGEPLDDDDVLLHLLDGILLRAARLCRACVGLLWRVMRLSLLSRADDVDGSRHLQTQLTATDSSASSSDRGWFGAPSLGEQHLSVSARRPRTC